MDIRNNLSSNNHFSPYSASSYPTVTNVDGGLIPPSSSTLHRGDSLTPFDSRLLSPEPVRHEINLHQALKSWKMIRAGTLITTLLSGTIFILLIFQPLLVLLFTLGGCVSDGCEEWVEFSAVVMLASLVPGSIAILGGLLSLVSHLTVHRIRRQMTKKKQEA